MTKNLYFIAEEAWFHLTKFTMAQDNPLIVSISFSQETANSDHCVTDILQPFFPSIVEKEKT